ncbi:MAG: hypothetical protein K5765_07895 [Clostridia bacterium]|nr:hypothetical protein [Clostridia bacterium]
MAKYEYFRLDNSAIVYQMVLTDNTQSLFRLGVILNEKIDPEILKEALDKALIRYPFFKTEIKNGFFRPYLIVNKRKPIVEEDTGSVLSLINFRTNNRYLFRITYFENKINIDYFHVLCDGTGGMEFLKTIVYYYLELINHPISNRNIRTNVDNYDINEEIEDAFDKYYTPISIKEGTKAMLSGTAYPLRGACFHHFGLGLISMYVDTDSLLKVSREHNCTITEFISSLFILSILKKYQGYKPIDKKIIAFVPINMRKNLPSKTLGNFTLFSRVVVDSKIEQDLDKIIEEVKSSFKVEKSMDLLQKKLSFTSFMTKNKILHFVPLIFKSIVSAISKNVRTSTVQTFVISNLGKVDIDNNDKINSFFFYSNANRKTPSNIGIVSYKDRTCISFTRKLISKEIETNFFYELKKYIEDIEVQSNYREDDDAL